MTGEQLATRWRGPVTKKDFNTDMRFMLKSKIHLAKVTSTDFLYEGSVSIGPDLLRAADIVPYEQVHLLNMETGRRLVTYALPDIQPGVVQVNGAAAQAFEKGDRVIILSYTIADEIFAANAQPRLVIVDEENRPRRPGPLPD